MFFVCLSVFQVLTKRKKEKRKKMMNLAIFKNGIREWRVSRSHTCAIAQDVFKSCNKSRTSFGG